MLILALVILIAAVVLGVVAHPLFWLLAIFAFGLFFYDRRGSRL